METKYITLDIASTLTEFNESNQILFTNPKKHQDTLKAHPCQTFVFDITKASAEENVHCAGSWFYVDIDLRECKDFENYVRFFQTLDQYLIDVVYENRLAWFKQDIPKEMIASFYEPSLKGSILRVKTPAENKIATIPIYLLSLFETDIDETSSCNVQNSLDDFLKKPVAYTIEVNTLRFLKNKFSCEFKLQHVKVRDIPTYENSDKLEKVERRQQMMEEVKRSVQLQLDAVSKQYSDLQKKYETVVEKERVVNDMEEDEFMREIYSILAIPETLPVTESVQEEFKFDNRTVV